MSRTKAKLRVATAVLSERIYAGYPTKSGSGFREPRHDVTSDVLVAIKDKVGIGNEITVEAEGVPQFRIAVLPSATSNTGIIDKMAEAIQRAERILDRNLHRQNEKCDDALVILRAALSLYNGEAGK